MLLGQVSVLCRVQPRGVLPCPAAGDDTKLGPCYSYSGLSDCVGAKPPSDSVSTSSVSKRRITCFILVKLCEIVRIPDRICNAQVQVSVA